MEKIITVWDPFVISNIVVDPTLYLRTKIFEQHSSLEPVQFLTAREWPEPFKSIFVTLFDEFPLSALTRVISICSYFVVALYEVV